MRVTVSDVSSHLCKVLTIIIVKTYLETGRRRYRIARRPVVTCYNSVKPPETSKSVRKRRKTHSFSAGRTSRNGLITEIIPIFQLEHFYSSPPFGRSNTEKAAGNIFLH